MTWKALLFSCLGLAACAPALPPDAPRPVTLDEAIADAEVARPDKVSRNLNPVSLGNPRLRSKEEGGERWVLVVTWVDHKGYHESVGKAHDLGKYEVWVTLSPELQDACRALAPEDVARKARLTQLLGLRPDKPKEHVVEMWARASDLFRPCPDPETDDRSCDLDFPPGVSPDHVKWFEEKRQSSYGPSGYPWTRLGYTYDWGRGDGVRIGLSEYVIRKGSTVKVASISTVADYCR